jgi:hypothetical protein
LVNLLISIDNLKVTQEDFDVALRYYRIDILKILQEYYQVQEVKKLVEANAIEKSVVTIQNNSNNSLNVIHTAEIPAHSKAVITTEISKI